MPRPASAVPAALLLAGLALTGGAAWAQQPPRPPGQTAAPASPGGGATAPRRLGSFGAWTAATYSVGGQKVCYAFTPAARSEPRREGVMLMVTHRAGQSRDELAMRAGHTYARGAPDVTLTAAGAEAKLYTNAESAHARAPDRRALIAAMRRAGARGEAVARGPAPGGRGSATDTFPLSGFAAAHDAISRECPAPGGRR